MSEFWNGVIFLFTEAGPEYGIMVCFIASFVIAFVGAIGMVVWKEIFGSKNDNNNFWDPF
jgi:hypothetical protein